MDTQAKSNGSIPDAVRGDIDRLGLSDLVNDEVLARLAGYLDLLLEVNRQFNLTAVRDRDRAWGTLIVDSLTPLAGLEGLVPEGAGIIDVGSGGGLPGVPIALALPGVAVTLLEATGKKARFLERCVSELGIKNVRVVQGRAETVGQQGEHRERYDVSVCRAVGPMRVVLEYLLPLVRVGGVVMVMKGPKAEGELEEAGDAMVTLGAGQVRVYDAYPEGFGRDTVIVAVDKEGSTPKAYPRLPGVPGQTPL